jgi:ADP-ribose pyrophosphatase YjhB (NUDIX family)
VTSGWLPEADRPRVQQQLPVACVDVLAIRGPRAGPAREAGLIVRDGSEGSAKRCLIGGRLLIGETLPEAIGRQVRATFGDGVPLLDDMHDVQPIYVAQHLREPRPGFAHDPPRQAIGLTFAVGAEGDPHPQGGARAFAWFRLEEIPLLKSSASA